VRIQGTAGTAPASKSVKPVKARKQAPVYVPPVSLAPKAEQRAARTTPSHYTPPAPRPAPKPAPIVTRTQRQHALEARQAIRAQGRAVRRAAAEQKVLGPGHVVVVPHGKSLTPARLRVAAQRESYVSLGEAVQHAAAQQRAAKTSGTVTVHGAKVPRVLFAKDPQTLKRAGFKTTPLADAITQMPVRALVNAPRDFAELAVTTPTTLAHEGVKQVKAAKDIYTGHPAAWWKTEKQIAKETLVDPYKQALINPKTHHVSLQQLARFSGEHPVSAYLMFSPGLKAPGHVAGRVARLAGKSTLRTGEAGLSGTALKEVRRGNRNILAAPTRRILGDPLGRIKRQVTGAGGPEITRAELRGRVDLHRDLNQHLEHQTVREHQAAARKATKGQPRHVREQAHAEATQAGHEQARQESRVRTAREFGANVEPDVSIHDVDAAKELRDQTEARAQEATNERRQAEAEHKTALDNAKRAREKRKSTSRLTNLRRRREQALRDLNTAQREHQASKVELAKAQGSARVSQTQTKGSPLLDDLTAQRRRVEQAALDTPHDAKVDLTDPEQVNRLLAGETPHGTTADAIKVAQRRVSRADQAISSIERQLRDAEQKGANLAGRTQGRSSAGRMTQGASKAVADQVAVIERLHSALHDAHNEAGDARDDLAGLMSSHRSRVRAATRDIDARIKAERRRLAGVAPRVAERLRGAIAQHDEAPARIRTHRQRVRDIDAEIAAEQKRIAGVPPAEADALRRAIHGKEDARASEQDAREAAAVARRIHIDTLDAHRHTDLVNPAGEGRIYDDPREAKRVAYRLNQQGHRMPSGNLARVEVHEPDPTAGSGPGSIKRAFSIERGGHVPVQFVAKEIAPDQWSVLPKDVSQRLYGGGPRGSQLGHASVGTSRSTGAVLMRHTRTGLTKSTLPFSSKWLLGQGGEALIRAVTTGAGGIDWVRFRKIVKAMNEDEPGSGDAFAARIGGGQFDPQGAIAEQIGSTRTAEREFAGTGLHIPAAIASKGAEIAPARWTGKTVRAWTSAIMSGVNHAIERNTRMAMAGHAIRHGPLMEDQAVGTLSKAIDQAARGLKGTAEQVEALRDVNNAYGKYSGWSPEMRSLLAHWTPFLPWYLNVANYLLRVMPRDHPYRTATITAMNQADEEWRKQHHLSFYGKQRVPDFLLGSLPLGKDRYVRVAHYTPWGVGSDLTGAAGSLVLPQFETPIMNAFGDNYLGKPLTKKNAKGKEVPFSLGDRTIRMLMSFGETQVPGLGLAGRVTGIEPRLIDKRTNVPKTLAGRAKAELPLMPTASSVKKKRKRGLGGSLGGGGLGGGGLGGGGL
jgi:hypothetical protein